MKILFVAGEHPHFGATGGIGSYLAIIAPTLARRGHEVHVLVCRSHSADDHMDGDVHLHLRPAHPVPALGRVRHLSLTHQRISAARATAQGLRDLGVFDAIEAPEWMAPSLFLSNQDRARLVINLHTSIGVIAKHGDYLGRDARLADRLENRTIRRARAVTSPSALLIDEMQGRGCPRDKVGIIRLPIDLAAWRPDAVLAQDEPRVLVVGRLEERKGLDVLVRSMAMMPERLRQIPVVAVGRSSGQKDGLDYAGWVKGLAHDNDVRFEHHEALPRTELAKHYATARVVAVPSRFESFSMAAVEGMASGTPVVCTRTCGAAELIAGTEAGRTVPPEDPAALRDALLPYLEDAPAARRAGDLARSIVQDNCDPELVASQRERVYEECAS
ncbi:MAG TPA: glycosyltransferase family 4 protein [Actinomycetota bacterium]|nr:glycosyltransferase family 4 protein [Actinomycetota bacterium]